MKQKKEDISTNFAGGILDPKFHSRIDMEGFNNTLRKAEDVIAVVDGGVRKFFGSRNVEIRSDFINSDNVALIPFSVQDFIDDEVSPNNIFCLVFHDGRIDAYDENNFWNLGIPFQDGINYKELRYIKLNDYLICVHRKLPPFKIVYRGRKPDGSPDLFLSSIQFVDVPYFGFDYNGLYSGRISTSQNIGIININALDISSGVLQIPMFISNSSGQINVSANIYEGHVGKETNKTNNTFYDRRASASLGNVKVVLYRNRAEVISTVAESDVNRSSSQIGQEVASVSVN